MARVGLVGLTKVFPGGSVGLQPTELMVESSECVALLGPTGSGKSTLLRLVAGLERPTTGEVWIGGERVDGRPPYRRGLSLLPQRVALYPHLTVSDNLNAVSRTWQHGGTSLPVVKSLAPLLTRYPHQLSGGQRQLVGLAKLVVQRRSVWLLDEPFTGLDIGVREEFRHDLHLLHVQSGATIVLVTHDPADAVALGHRIGILGDGRLKQLGTPDELRARPSDRFTAVCLAGMSLLAGRVVGDGDSACFTAAEGAVSGPVPWGTPDNLTLGIRPADLLTVPPGTAPSATKGILFRGWPVVSAEPVGSGWFLTLARDHSQLRAVWPTGSPPPVGTVMDWQLLPDCCHWFHGDTGERVGD